MKTQPCIALFLFTFICSVSAADSKIEKAVRDQDAQWSKASESRDLEKLLPLYADDAVVLPAHAAIATTKDSIRNIKLLSIPGVALSWKPTKVTAAGSGDLAYFDVVTFNAVWMCLASREARLDALSEIARLLRSNGHLVASVTHPCFRTCKFSNYFTDFNNRDYFNDGTLFNVTIYDGKRELHIVDTHWSLTAMSSQLNESGFVIENLYELPRSTNGSSERNASLWLVIIARKL